MFILIKFIFIFNLCQLLFKKIININTSLQLSLNVLSMRCSSPTQTAGLRWAGMRVKENRTKP